MKKKTTDPYAEHRWLFHEGKDVFAYKYFGAHFDVENETAGVTFRVWAPNAASVSVVGDFNGWDKTCHIMHHPENDSTIWELFIPGLRE